MKTAIRYFLALMPISLMAQTWQYEADVQAQTPGQYHEIFLSPEVISHLAPEAANLRLVDESGSELPYLYQPESWQWQESEIKWLPTHGSDYWRRWYSRSFFENPGRQAIDRIVLKIRNADVNQEFWLSGSDDMQNWYIIKENFQYHSNYDPSSTWNLVTIHFPMSDYRYFKVEVKHHWHEPIQIMGAGIYAHKDKKGLSQSVPDPLVSQSEEGSKSIVSIHFDAEHAIDQMVFEVDGPEMYLRQAKLERKTTSGSYQFVKNVELSSKSLAQLELESLRGQDWHLIVENKSDKPIRIAGVQARQRRQVIKAKLEAKSTKLVLGEMSMRAPEYDLQYFAKDLPSRLPGGQLSALRVLDQAQSTAVVQSPTLPPKAAEKAIVEEEKPFYQQKAFLWAGILLIALLVGGMSIMLWRDMKGKQEP